MGTLDSMQLFLEVLPYSFLDEFEYSCNLKAFSLWSSFSLNDHVFIHTAQLTRLSRNSSSHRKCNRCGVRLHNCLSRKRPGTIPFQVGLCMYLLIIIIIIIIIIIKLHCTIDLWVLRPSSEVLKSGPHVTVQSIEMTYNHHVSMVLLTGTTAMNQFPIFSTVLSGQQSHTLVENPQWNTWSLDQWGVLIMVQNSYISTCCISCWLNTNFQYSLLLIIVWYFC